MSKGNKPSKNDKANMKPKKVKAKPESSVSSPFEILKTGTVM